MTGATTPRWNLEVGDHELRLAAGESIGRPRNPKRRIYGPALIKYTIYADGGIDATVFPLSEKEGRA